MPTYRGRSLHDYPTEFYRSVVNPSGFAFACVFCPTLYETNGEYIAHMKECCREEDMEYSDSLLIEEGITMYDHHRNQASKSATVRDFLASQELASFADLPSNQILELIQASLLEHGYKNKAFYVYSTSVAIYQFLFVQSEEERSEFHRTCAEHIYADIQEHLQSS
jgi:hypothetical protein